MTTKLQTYDNHKPSGVEWLGDIPEHWEAKKIKFLFSIGRGRVIAQTELIENGLYPVYSSQTQDNGVLGYINTFDFDCNQITWTTDGANAGTVFLREGKHNCTNVCGTLQPYNKNQVIEFVTYSLQVAAQFYKRPDTNGAKIMNGEMAEIFVTLPPFSEQTAIAKFLDDKTAKIDQAITIKKNQIELLKERKHSLINKAVTKGINPNVKLKPSGVDWIGEIPEGWVVKKLGYLANCFPSNIDKHSKVNEKEVRLCNYTDVYKNDYITDDMDLMLATATEEQITKFTLKKGDIVITKDSETASDIAVPTYIKEDLTNVVCGYHLAMIRTYQRSYSKYLFRALQTKLFNIQFEVCSNGITRVGLGSSDLKNGYFLVPSEKEQIEIAEFIEMGTTKIAKAISLKEQEIEKLKEYKMSLIDGVVTGKVRVF